MATYALSQWFRSRVLKDHDYSAASERQIAKEIPKPLTQAEYEEGLSL